MERWDEAEALRLGAGLAALSEHPVSRAIVAAADHAPEAQDFHSETGMGLSGRVDGHNVRLGNARFLDHKAEAGDVFIEIDGTVEAALTISDAVKPTATEAAARLHGLGLKTALISGDTTANAEAVARQIGIADATAGVRPEGKVAAVRHLKAPVAFVGDGINDAPVLAEAEVGIGLGTGTDIAVEAGDVVLVSGDPRGVVTAVELSRAVMRNIRQNPFWAFAYNAALIPVAAGVFFPATGLMLSPMLAADAMSLSSLFVVSNALRLNQAVAR